jgi:ubiquinone biosynthesis protein UbiJ
MDALETLLRPVAAMINRQITARTPARKLCAELDGRVLAVRVPDTALAAYLQVTDGVVSASANYEEEPDVVVSGSVLSLARMAGPEGESLFRDGTVAINGDALVAQQFQRLLRYGRPDLEEELSTVIGDVAAHGVGEFVRGAVRWVDETRRTMGENVGEYLQEESRAVPCRHEVDAFRKDVNELRDDVARFEARLRAHEERRG